MEQAKYWQVQGKKRVFSEIDIERPEQRQMAGKLLIIGGNKMSFFGVANAASKAIEIGVGEVKVLLPESLKKQVPGSSDVIFAPNGVSGGFGKEALRLAVTASENADMVLLIGDMGKNSETVVFAERLLRETVKPVMVTRDAVELLATSAGDWLGRGDVSLLAALPQLQKVFRAVYYPKIITLSMPMNQLVETLHKFTISYSVTVTTYHNERIVTASGGEVVSTAIKDTAYNPISMWVGDLAVRMAVLQLWNPGKVFEASASAVLW